MISRLVRANFFLSWSNEHTLRHLKPFAVVGEMLLFFWIGTAVATLVSHGRIVAGAVEADL